MRVQAVLDSVALNHLTRRPKKTRKAGRDHYETSIDGYIKGKKLELTLDRAGGLQSEWEQTCGRDAVRVIVTRWMEAAGIRHVAHIEPLPQACWKKLKAFGFNDAIDKLVLKLAITTDDGLVVSHDPDFWDPCDPDSPGEAKSVVARYCSDELDITVILVPELSNKLNGL